MKPTLSIALLLVLAAPLAHAHGDSSHTRQAFDPATAEQKSFGIAGDPKHAGRTIKVTMSDRMRFEPSRIVVKRGETVNFIIANRGKLRHEMVIGTAKDLQEHAELMKRFPNMKHDETFMSHVAPGKSERLVWRFNQPGAFEFGCLVGGHFEAGMSGKIDVLDAADYLQLQARSSKRRATPES